MIFLSPTNESLFHSLLMVDFVLFFSTNFTLNLFLHVQELMTGHDSTFDLHEWITNYSSEFIG